jgi:hypothetical protein
MSGHGSRPSAAAKRGQTDWSTGRGWSWPDGEEAGSASRVDTALADRRGRLLQSALFGPTIYFTLKEAPPLSV